MFISGRRCLIFILLIWCVIAVNAQLDTTQRIVSGITVLDNKVTKESIIIRELTLSVGDTISVNQIEEHLNRSASNVYNTRLFNFVEVIPNEVDGRYIEFIVKVVERWYIWPLVILDFADPNFNTWWQTKDFSRLNYGLGAYHTNFRGRKESLGFLVQLGYSKRFRVTYEIPFITKKQNLGIGFSYSFTQNDQITYATNNNIRLFLDGTDGRLQQQQVGKVNLSWRNDLYNKHDFEVRYTDVRVDDTLLTVAADYFSPNTSKANYFSIVYNYAHDKRDNAAYPLTGYALGATVVKSGLGTGIESGVNVTYGILNARWHWHLGGKFYSALGLRGRATLQGEIPYYIQHGFGYRQYVRGYELYIVDGQHYLLGKGNLKFQLIAPKKNEITGVGLTQFSLFHYSLYLNLHADAGTVWDSFYAKQNTLANETLFGWGGGVDLVAYYDKMVRIEYSFNSIGEHGMFVHFVKSF